MFMFPPMNATDLRSRLEVLSSHSPLPVRLFNISIPDGSSQSSGLRVDETRTVVNSVIIGNLSPFAVTK